MRDGNADALEDLIRGAAEGRAGWQMGAPRMPGAPSCRRRADRRCARAPDVRHPLPRPAAAARRRAAPCACPARKSISNRVLLLAGLAEGTTRGARPAGLRRHPRHARRAARAGLRRCGATARVLHVTGLGGRLRGARGAALPGQRRHRDAPAGRGAGGAGGHAGRALRAQRRAAHARAADRRPGRRAAPAGLHDRRPGHSPATRRCACSGTAGGAAGHRRSRSACAATSPASSSPRCCWRCRWSAQRRRRWSSRSRAN